MEYRVTKLSNAFKSLYNSARNGLLYRAVVQKTIASRISCVLKRSFLLLPTVPSALLCSVQQMQPAYIAYSHFAKPVPMQGIVIKFTMQMLDDELDRRKITTGLGRFESDKAGYVKALLIVSRLLSGSMHREDANLVLHCLPEDHASQ